MASKFGKAMPWAKADVLRCSQESRSHFFEQCLAPAFEFRIGDFFVGNEFQTKDAFVIAMP